MSLHALVVSQMMTSLVRVLLLHQHRAQGCSSKSLRNCIIDGTQWTHRRGILNLNISFTLIIISLYDWELLGFSTVDKIKWKTQ